MNQKYKYYINSYINIQKKELEKENELLTNNMSNYSSKIYDLSNELKDLRKKSNNEIKELNKYKNQVEEDNHLLNIKIKDLEGKIKQLNFKLKVENVKNSNKYIQNNVSAKDYNGKSFTTLNQSNMSYFDNNSNDNYSNENQIQTQHMELIEESNRNMRQLLSQLRGKYIELDNRYQSTCKKLESVEGEYLIIVQKYEFLLEQSGNIVTGTYINDPTEMNDGIDLEFEYFIRIFILYINREISNQLISEIDKYIEPHSNIKNNEDVDSLDTTPPPPPPPPLSPETNIHPTFVNCAFISFPIISRFSIDYVDIEYLIYDILDLDMNNLTISKSITESSQLSILNYSLLEFIENDINTEEIDEDNNNSTILLTSNIIPICSFPPQTVEIKTSDNTPSSLPKNDSE